MGQKAFTVLEILIVVLIIATLTIIAIPIFQGMTIKAKLTQMFIDINAMERDFDLLVAEKGFCGEALDNWSLIDNSKYYDYFCCAGLWPGVWDYYGVLVRTKIGLKVV